MTTPKPLEIQYRCQSISDAGNSKVTVNFSQVDENDVTPTYGGVPGYGSFSVTLSQEERRAYFPGSLFTITIAPVE